MATDFNGHYSYILEKERANMSKGIPIPGTGRRTCGGYCCHSSSGKSGVMGGSRILAHRYMDELDNGKWHRREIRRKEKAFWLSEALSEIEEDLYDDEPDF
ncbi:hypothetical protein SEA_STARBOW_259 [Streptomyces phage Starbow]|jgi:hypothetical protein|uniref:Uncharacterized protein n=2 Tax=Streptomyces virus Karimac TaxID=2846401 RepID=A0A890UUF7_9CAUD|nr:hypothetical protein SEA_STARBOW_2 [Streptomyces phage Starbow]QRI45692.1 hypothetical protein SEA_BATTUTA_2 [Streptomyces phage Battuta]URM86578.1 hypothetical protein SEA_SALTYSPITOON_2 [Streptomyces phage SaltySpitoon]URM87530.1 hypothetical protein SEA_QUARAN19_2 [Streptomyces phage Quaran19]UVK60850.1 hypothetical protein SEA_JIMJAM_2 [Streptomyces phage JimJam]WGH19791.1 hypothetical protein SEA_PUMPKINSPICE_2 [Streptomyces phage PumpkinSpice]WPH58331.1 hypothetical protein SEA_SPELL